jgi:hypothetical protein
MNSLDFTIADRPLYVILDPELCGGHQPALDLLGRVIKHNSDGICAVQLRAPG